MAVFLRHAVLLLVVTLAGGAGARAAEPALDLLDAATPFTADFYFSGDKGTYHGVVWHMQGRERREFDTAGGGQAVVIRRDTGKVYLMKPGARMYVGLSLEAAAGLAGGLDRMTVTRTKVREETVAGLRATRYRLDARTAAGDRFEGEGWFSRQGIMLRAIGTVTSRGGRALAVETGLSNVKVGTVDASRFDLPAGALALDLSKVPADRIEEAVNGMRAMMER